MCATGLNNCEECEVQCVETTKESQGITKEYERVYGLIHNWVADNFSDSEKPLFDLVMAIVNKRKGER